MTSIDPGEARMSPHAASESEFLDHTGFDVGLLPVRLFVGFFTVYAGVQLVVSDADFPATVAELGVPFPAVAAFLVVLGHLGLGVLLILGFITRPVGALLAVKYLLIFYIYYVHEDFGRTLSFISKGTLWGVESLAYGFAGILFLCVGGGRFSVDAVVRSWVYRRGTRPPRWMSYLWVHPEPDPAAANSCNAQAAGRVLFRLFVGALLALHGISQIVGRGSKASMHDLAARLDTAGFPLPTFLAWVATLMIIAAGMLLLLGLFARFAGAALIVTGVTLFLAVPEMGGTTAAGLGFHGEELLFLSVTGIFFACSGSGPFSLTARRARQTAQLQ